MPKEYYQDEFFESETYIDGPKFKAYAQKIKRLILAHETPISIRGIHLLLGDDARPEWTADALEAISGIVAIGILPTRYCPANARPVDPPTPFGRLRA